MKGKRKRICLMLVVVLMLGAWGSIALAQERPGNVVSTNVVSLIQGAINLQYERVLNPGMSFYVTPSLGFGGGATAFGATAGIKKYFQPTAPEGFWFGGFGSFTYVSTLGISVTGFGGGANVGYKYFLTDKFTIEGSIGLAYVYMSMGPFGGAGGFGTALGASIGYAF